MSKQAFDLLVAESVKHKLPEVHERDLLVHDLAQLTKESAPDRFGWVLYSCGTHLIDLRMKEQSLWGFLRHIKLNWKPGTWKFYTWDGKALNEHNSYEPFEHACMKLFDACKVKSPVVAEMQPWYLY